MVNPGIIDKIDDIVKVELLSSLMMMIILFLDIL